MVVSTLCDNRKFAFMWNSIQVLPNQVRKNSFYTFKDDALQDSHGKLKKNRVKLWNRLNLKTGIYCLPRNFNGFPMYFAQCLFTEMKSTFY